MHRATADHGSHHSDLLDVVGIDVVGILGEDHEVRQLAGLDRALEVLLERGMGAVDGLTAFWSKVAVRICC